MEDVHRWVASLPSGKIVNTKDVAKKFNLGSSATGGRFVASSPREKIKIKNGVYQVI